MINLTQNERLNRSMQLQQNRQEVQEQEQLEAPVDALIVDEVEVGDEYVTLRWGNFSRMMTRDEYDNYNQE